MRSLISDLTSNCRNATVTRRKDVGMTGNGAADECCDEDRWCPDESDEHAVVDDVDVARCEELLLCPDNPVRLRPPSQRLFLERAEHGVGQKCSSAGQATGEELILACPAVVAAGVDRMDDALCSWLTIMTGRRQPQE